MATVENARKLTKEQEKKLMQQSLQDTEAFGKIYDQYYSAILGFVYRRLLNQFMAEDIASQAFCQAFVKRAWFKDQGHGVSAWLYKIAHNCLMDHFRQSKKCQILEFKPEQIDCFHHDDNTPQTMVLAKEQLEQDKQQQKLLLQQMRHLSSEDQLILSLKYFENQKNQQIAETLGIKANALGVRLHRALAKLRALVTRHMEEQT